MTLKKITLLLVGLVAVVLSGTVAPSVAQADPAVAAFTPY